MVTLCENIILWDLLYCFRISIFDAVSQFNDSAHKREVSYLLKKLAKLAKLYTKTCGLWVYSAYDYLYLFNLQKNPILPAKQHISFSIKSTVAQNKIFEKTLTKRSLICRKKNTTKL